MFDFKLVRILAGEVKRGWLLIFLLLANLYGAVFTVYTSQVSRSLRTELSLLYDKHEALKNESKHLLLEESVLSDPWRIERMAKEAGMIKPLPENRLQVSIQK